MTVSLHMTFSVSLQMVTVLLGIIIYIKTVFMFDIIYTQYKSNLRLEDLTAFDKSIDAAESNTVFYRTPKIS